jgi:SagB-type dehydrogenase family enzyme
LVSAAWADVKLSAPKTSGGAGIFELVEKRASGTRDNFPKGDISLEELSTILWAATGRNRGGNGWTVPTAGGLPPYVKIYAVKKDGVFMYDWKAHSLTEISTNDARGDITSDNFVKASPIVLIFVSDTNDLGSMGKLNVGNSLAYTAAGAMSQNAYLAADALGISTRYMVSMNADAVKRVLKLNPANVPLCILPLGKR